MKRPIVIGSIVILILWALVMAVVFRRGEKRPVGEVIVKVHLVDYPVDDMRQPVFISLKNNAERIAGTNRILIDIGADEFQVGVWMGYMAALDMVGSGEIQDWSKDVRVAVSNIVGKGTVTLGPQ